MHASPDVAEAGARRAVLALLAAALCAPTAARAQDGNKPWRIAFLAAGSPPRPGQVSTFDVITAGLRERGFSALQTQAWFAEGRTEALPALAQQALAWQPDVIVTNLTPATLAAHRATRNIPIVMAGSGDPVATGLVQSLSRPGGNVTGVAALGPELAAKSIELMAELRPGLRRLGALVHATDPFTPALLQALQPAAMQLGLQLQIERVREPAQYAAAFAAWARQRAEAVFVQPSLAQRPAIELALQQGLPSCSFVRGFVEQGGLLAYAADQRETARLAADMADRILRGASPAQLPVQQSSRFDLLINLRTAAALQLKLPAGVLARATEVFE
jgi:putative tryptophan/tyrosine transport system substrate-binding protein